VIDSIFNVCYFIGFIVGSVIRAIYTRQYKQNRITDDRKTVLDSLLMSLSSLGMIVIPLIYVFSPWLDFADYHLPTWVGLTAGLLGVAVFVVALYLLFRSHTDLGRNWSPTLQIREEHSLVTAGVFHYIRHPMYATHWLWAIAQALLLQNFLAGLAMLPTFLPIYLLRVKREEKMMIDHFGEEYRLYMNRTGQVIPTLRR